MFKNYLLTALRHIRRNRMGTFINIAGLAIGISSCILILIYVRYETTYDRHHSKSDRIYRVASEIHLQQSDDKVSFSSFQVGPTLKKDYPQIESFVRLMPIGKQSLWIEDKPYSADDLFYTDSTLFQILDYKLLKGNPNTALTRPRSIVLSQEMATRLFGKEDPMGKDIQFTKNTFTVTGIFKKDEKHPTHITSNAFLSINTLDTVSTLPLQVDWFRMVNYTYVLLKNRSDSAAFDKMFTALNENYVKPMVQQYNLNGSITYYAQPIQSIHFDDEFKFDYHVDKGNKAYLYIFSVVAFFILLIACINYMNLATAKAAKRTKEVGIRKVMGASRRQLIMQFTGESIIITLLSFIAALLLVELMLPLFNYLTEKDFDLGYLAHGELIFILTGIILFVGLLGGSYPAFYLSSFNPSCVLRSSKTPRSGAAILRKSLVVLQFIISTVLIIGTTVVYRQMHFMKNSDLGFSKDQVLVVEMSGANPGIEKKLPILKQELEQHSGIADVATTIQVPGQGFGKLIFYQQNDGKNEEVVMPMMFTDHEALKMLKVPLVKGRYFSEEFAGDDTAAFIINEAAAEKMGWDEPIGKRLVNGLGYNGQVVGVVKNFHFSSLHNPIEPLVVMIAKGPGGNLLVRLTGNKPEEAISFIEDKWKEFDPKRPIEYYFLDEQFNIQYAREEKMLAIFGYFAALTIFIACLGLYGLAAHTAEQRTKEIGIRKVNGASERDIVLLFVKDFMKLVGIALLIAWPIAWYLMTYWLEDFAYRISLSPLIFLLAGIAATLIALATITWQAISSAMTNPVKALRYE